MIADSSSVWSVPEIDRCSPNCSRISMTVPLPDRPFTDDEAGRLANYSGCDVYSVLSDDEGPVAYGMLRGWDEGYVTPSLGIAVRRSAKGRGMGRRMMDQLHAEARRRGAPHGSTPCRPDNETARRLYEGVGYTYRGLERGELVMVLDLTPSPEPRDHP